MDKRPFRLITARALRSGGRGRHALALLGILAVSLVLSVALGSVPAGASPGDDYSGPYFGADNFPPGCIRDMSATNPGNVCHHMRTGLNALDSPKVDVLVMVPAVADRRA